MKMGALDYKTNEGVLIQTMTGTFGQKNGGKAKDVARGVTLFPLTPESMAKMLVKRGLIEIKRQKWEKGMTLLGERQKISDKIMDKFPNKIDLRGKNRKGAGSKKTGIPQMEKMTSIRQPRRIQLLPTAAWGEPTEHGGGVEI